MADWSRLPSVAVSAVLERLPASDRLRASSCCRSWRQCLFRAPLWRSFVLRPDIRSADDRRGAAFLSSRVARFVRSADVRFESALPANVVAAAALLDALAENPDVRFVRIRPASGRLEHRERAVVARYVEALKALIRRSRRLEGIAFGCVEEIVDSAGAFLRLLGERHGASLRFLYLASVKENPERYEALDIAPSLFGALWRLQRLSLDYDYLSEALLEELCRPEHAPLDRLDVHVHGAGRPLSDGVWRRLCRHSQRLEVGFTLLHSPAAVGLLLDILRPSIRLVRFSQYFCTEVNCAAVNFVAETYAASLRSIAIVDSMEGFRPEFYQTAQEDPFVMLAWRCENLADFTLVGYNIAVNDLIAIARLRGPQLKHLKVPECCIQTDLEERSSGLGRLTREVSSWLDQRQWRPVANERLHAALVDYGVDAIGVYIPTIFEEQAW